MSLLSIRGEVRSLSSYRASRAGVWLWLQVVEERERWPLWLPVGFGAGIFLYFLATIEPPPWLGGTLLLLAVVGATFARIGGGRRPVLFFAAICVGIVSAGFSVAQLRSARVAAPILERTLDFVEVTGRIVRVQPLSGGARLILADVETDEILPGGNPARVRIRVGGKGATDFSVGDRIKALARLLPPPGPVVPGGFDFQRSAWFSRIGAVGFSFGLPERTASAEQAGPVARASAVFAAWRAKIFDRVTARLVGAAGGVAAALMTGQRSAY